MVRPCVGQNWSVDPDLTKTWVQENHEVRLSLKNLIFSSNTQMPGVDLTILPKTSSRSVRVRSTIQEGALYLLFLNEAGNQYSGINDSGINFPIAGEGNYIIKRNIDDGRFVQVKIFYRNHPGCFLRIFPEGDRSSMDIYLFDIPVYKNIALPLDFRTLLTEPFERILRLSKHSVDWDLLLYRGQAEADRQQELLVKAIRASLPGLGDAEDGAMDADGKFVLISTGEMQAEQGFNCSGFSKWVVDGFVFPQTFRLMDIEMLTQKHLAYRGNRWSLRYEEERDPYFGLDWSRNLAMQHYRIQMGLPVTESMQSDPERFDVRELQFLSYREDIGFPVEELELLLFLETRQNPGHFYLGSINREYGENPVLRQHFHLVVLFPFFTEKGQFRVVVFERGVESTQQSLQKRFGKNFIHLVRLSATGPFSPPTVE